MPHEVNSIAILERYELSWRILGLITNQNSSKFLCGLYDLLLTVCVTILYPLHLIGGIIISKTEDDFFNSLTIGISCVACTLKHIIYRRKLQEMQDVKKIFKKLDARIQDIDESEYFEKSIRQPSNFMMIFFSCTYNSACFVGILSVIVSVCVLGKEWHLVYPGYVIFEWRNSKAMYICILAYQYIGLSWQIIQNLSSDIYGPLIFCMFAGHVHILSMRINKIGHDKERSKNELNQDLIDCIQDYNHLMRIFTSVKNIVSLGCFTQFCAVVINVGVALIYLIFFADNAFAYIYYTMNIIAIAAELFPCCYYGTILEYEFEVLPYAIFTSNWIVQSRTFRRNILLFTELSLKERALFAGGMFRIHLRSFLGTCRLAYSFVTVMQKMKSYLY